MTVSGDRDYLQILADDYRGWLMFSGKGVCMGKHAHYIGRPSRLFLRDCCGHFYLSD